MAHGSVSSQAESDLILSQITLLLRVTTEPKTLYTKPASLLLQSAFKKCALNTTTLLPHCKLDFLVNDF